MKLFASVVAASLLLSAQKPNEVPVAEEPQHKIVFKNDFVRVLDATLPSGYVTLNHRHDVDNVSITMSNGRDGEPVSAVLGAPGLPRVDMRIA